MTENNLKIAEISNPTRVYLVGFLLNTLSLTEEFEDYKIHYERKGKKTQKMEKPGQIN